MAAVGHDGNSSGLGMALGMLAHMPWYHYVLMAVAVTACAIAVHRRIRRTHWPQHATMAGIARTTVELLLILAGVELIAALVVVVAVTGGMLAYHEVLAPPMA